MFSQRNNPYCELLSKMSCNIQINIEIQNVLKNTYISGSLKTTKMRRHILGLDLGITSIGFAHVTESEDHNNSEIKQIGVRINSLSVDDQTNFEKGKPFSINAERTLKRGARRNLDRYQDRRKNLIEVLQKANLINVDTQLAEGGKNTTHETWALRAKAVSEKVEKEDFARILLAINKKRGYKSSRKAKNEEDRKSTRLNSSHVRISYAVFCLK